jgi:hypothetical protein
MLVLGVMLGLLWPSMRAWDWRGAMPADLGVGLPEGLRVDLPAGIELGLPAGWRIGLPRPGSGESAGAGGRFGHCHSGGGRNCVVDGDTFWMNGERVRIADIDTPETHPSRCAREARLGKAATLRLQALLNAGPVTLEKRGRDRDRYGRMLRVVTRDGTSLGERMVAEGLARPWEGRRRGWCGVGSA